MALPKGIDFWEWEDEDCCEAMETSSMAFNGGYVNGRRHKNTFAVKAMHETLPNSVGASFNVKTVTAALEEDLHKTKLGREETLS